MAQDLILAIGGMAILAVGRWLIGSRAHSRAVACLLCACGIVLIAISTGHANLTWVRRIAVFGTYTGTGGLLGSTIGNISLRGHAGAILANLRMVASAGLKVITAIAAPSPSLCSPLSRKGLDLS